MCVCVCEKVLGRELLLQLIDDLLQGYRGNESWATQILNSTRVHFLPTMNPDGFDQADTNCHLSQGRSTYTHTHTRSPESPES